jgi:pyruvate/2-oxoglutarate dehydrogenase complex dihydrolipoamide acyltransferase (E2) component
MTEVVMPAMGTSITEGEVIAWLKQPGDPVAADESICEISTDKVDSEIPAPAAGTLAEILVEAGQVVEVGVTLARIAAEGSAPGLAPGSMPDAAAEKAEPEVEAAPSTAGAGRADVSGDGQSDTAGDGGAEAAGDGRAQTASNGPASGNGKAKRFYSPVARRLAEDRGIDLDQVVGTGRNGRVTKRDVECFIATAAKAEPALHTDSPYRPDPPPVPPAAARLPSANDRPSEPDELGGDPQPLSRMRIAIGNAMRNSQQTAATCHTVVECDVTALEARRRELGVTALPLVARATIETLREFPDLNATLDGTTITRFERVHLGIAVSLGDDGLIVPVIMDAQDLSIEGLAARIKDLATRGRAKQLDPQEVQGATFTITNPGAFGASIATPVIDVPQVAILDLEAIIRRPIVVTDEAGGESIAIRSMVNLVLGWDHRAVDGVYAARFLGRLRAALQAW